MTWKNTLKENINHVNQLKSFIALSLKEERAMKEITNVFPISSTAYYLNLIDPNDPDDPIRKMAIPSIEEFELEGDFDTSGEGDNTVINGVQHKYAKTALILSTNKCAMYCRHCFRKRLVGVETTETLSFVDDAIHYIKNHPEINNVLISGGDAFLLNNVMIETYIEKLSKIGHIDFIRFGTRTPVVFPERIYDDKILLKVFEQYGKEKQIYVVTQFNHPKELTNESLKAIRALQSVGVIVNNQTVLLKGVNDKPSILSDLQNGLVQMGVIPYYIFQCRPVKGVKNQFQVPLVKAVKIIEEAKVNMSGLSKRLRFCMSHPTGKIEILGIHQEKLVLKYHQAKRAQNSGQILMKEIDNLATWL